MCQEAITYREAANSDHVVCRDQDQSTEQQLELRCAIFPRQIPSQEMIWYGKKSQFTSLVIPKKFGYERFYCKSVSVGVTE